MELILLTHLLRARIAHWKHKIIEPGLIEHPAPDGRQL